MSLPTPEGLLEPFGECLKKNLKSTGFEFPSIGQPGMPPILLGAAGAMLAPAMMILDFIPPSVDTVPKIKDMLTNLPKIIVDGFAASAVGLPKISISVAGLSFSVGDVDVDPNNFKSESLVKFVVALVTAPINIFKGILESLVSLKPKFPDLNMIKDVLGKAFSSFPKEVIPSFVSCLANTFMEVIKGIIP